MMVEIDGSTGSGGGQILRTACALSTATKKPCRVFNIRKSRPRPGLSHQHLLGIQSLARIFRSRLEGDRLGSEEIEIFPGEPDKNPLSLNVKIETAGSIPLVFQALIPATLFIENDLEIIFEGGATDTFFSPPLDYFRFVFLNILEKIGAKIEINIIRRGYYPEGGARIKAKIHPINNVFREQSSGLKNLNLTERGDFKRILAISGASELLKGKKVAERQLMGVREILGKLSLSLEEKIEYYQTRSPGSQICLAAEFENTIIGTNSLGKMGKRAEDLGKEAALELLKEERSKACLDKYMADQILPFMALSPGKNLVTVSEITDHCKTNIWVIEKFLKGKFEIKGNTIAWIPGN